MITRGRRSSETRTTSAGPSRQISPSVSWRLLRPVRKGEAGRAGQHLLKPLRQVIESVNWTLKGQLDLERHGGRTPEGIIARVLARILALIAAIWPKDKTAQPVKRSLIAFDH